MSEPFNAADHSNSTLAKAVVFSLLIGVFYALWNAWPFVSVAHVKEFAGDRMPDSAFKLLTGYSKNQVDAIDWAESKVASDKNWCEKNNSTALNVFWCRNLGADRRINEQQSALAETREKKYIEGEEFVLASLEILEKAKLDALEAEEKVKADLRSSGFENAEKWVAKGRAGCADNPAPNCFKNMVAREILIFQSLLVTKKKEANKEGIISVSAGIEYLESVKE